MILGSCNFGQDYNGSFVQEKEAIDIIKAYGDMGGKVIDSAFNYKSLPIIKKAKWKGKIITKVWHQEDLQKSLDILEVKKIYACLVRANNQELLQWLRSGQDVEKAGQSIYYENEINELSTIIQIPLDELWLKYLPTMLLHADVQIRSYFRLYKANKGNKINPKQLKETYERHDLKHNIDFVVGVSNIDQLKENMEFFG